MSFSSSSQGPPSRAEEFQGHVQQWEKILSSQQEMEEKRVQERALYASFLSNESPYALSQKKQNAILFQARQMEEQVRGIVTSDVMRSALGIRSGKVFQDQAMAAAVQIVTDKDLSKKFFLSGNEKRIAMVRRLAHIHPSGIFRNVAKGGAIAIAQGMLLNQIMKNYPGAVRSISNASVSSAVLPLQPKSSNHDDTALSADHQREQYKRFQQNIQQQVKEKKKEFGKHMQKEMKKISSQKSSVQKKGKKIGKYIAVGTGGFSVLWWLLL
jgi:hypothetical protein